MDFLWFQVWFSWFQVDFTVINGSRLVQIRAERWRREVRRWEHLKRYPLDLFLGPTIPLGLVMMMMMLMTTRNPLGPWWGHRCKWDPSKSLEGGRSCPRAHLNFQVSVFGSEKERFVLQPMDLDKLLKILIKPVKRSPSVPRSLLPSQTISISNSFARLSYDLDVLSFLTFLLKIWSMWWSLKH